MREAEEGGNGEGGDGWGRREGRHAREIGQKEKDGDTLSENREMQTGGDTQRRKRSVGPRRGWERDWGEGGVERGAEAGRTGRGE